ncbi:MAG: AEC family transporter [Lachnospiraceae bacterium]|nr:AEC family transporter [Lachnospiraceae bacterium]
MNIFLFAFNAISPIILLILLGYILKKINFLDAGWFKKGNKFVFRVCLPVLLFMNVYHIKSLEEINWTVVIYAEIIILLMFFLGLLLVKTTIPEDRQKGVILQCVFRSNFAIIGIPLAESLGGTEAMGIASILSAFSIPTFNILAVIALTMYNKDENGHKASLTDTLKKIVTNPLILGVAAGMVVLVIRSLIPTSAEMMGSGNEAGELIFSIRNDLPWLYTALNNISKISSPLALIVLGGQFDFAAVKELKKQIAIGTMARVVMVPAIALSVAIVLSTYTNLFHFSPEVYPALIALFGSPVAVSSAIMAQEMDNDGVLAGQLVVWTSIASIFTIFFFVVACAILIPGFTY